MITSSGQSAQAANDRITELRGQIDDYAIRQENYIKTISDAAQATRAETMVTFKQWRTNMELWYDGIKAKFDGGPEVQGRRDKGGGKGKGMDKKDIMVWK